MSRLAALIVALSILQTPGTPAALADADAALKLKPDAAPALDTRAHILEALGRREEAIADFRRALAIEPRLSGSREGLKRLGAAP